MTTTSAKLDALSVVLPRGTRVTLRTTIRAHEREFATGTAGVVADSDGRRYVVRLLSGESLDVGRDQIAPKSHAVLDRLHDEQSAFERYQGEIVLSVLVGSKAWGLDHAESDDDIRGVFAWRFEDFTGLYASPNEIHDASGDQCYWEIEKCIRQALRADPNTLETLWVPKVFHATALGERLRAEREIFTSHLVVGSFGRYAQGQAKKLAGAMAREAVLNALLDRIADGSVRTQPAAKALVAAFADEHAHGLTLPDTLRSVRDRGLLDVADFDALVGAVDAGMDASLRPRPVRPKNAYNLLRLLYSCLHWLDDHTPLIRVEGDVAAELRAVKEGQRSMDAVLARAETLGREIEAKALTSKLPEVPNHAAADAILREARRQAATRVIAGGAPVALAAGRGGCLTRAVGEKALPHDVDVDAVIAFFHAFERGQPRALPLIGVALTGAHAYGFPSPDSDLDLKAIHAASSQSVLARQPRLQPVETIEIFRGREFDFSSHEIGQVVSLIEQGNGNMLERLLGPFSIVTTPLFEQLAALTFESLSQRSGRHYRGFFNGSVREYQRVDDSGGRSVKRLLYAYRVALTGTHLLLCGELETDVRPLAQIYGFPRVSTWIERKQEAEAARLSPAEQDGVDAELSRLEACLDDAVARSTLPSSPPNMEALDAFVVRARQDAQAWEEGA